MVCHLSISYKYVLPQKIRKFLFVIYYIFVSVCMYECMHLNAVTIYRGTVCSIILILTFHIPV